jgi:hypothetical protein
VPGLVFCFSEKKTILTIEGLAGAGKDRKSRRRNDSRTRPDLESSFPSSPVVSNPLHQEIDPMSSKPSSPRHDTELEIDRHRKITHIDDPFNRVTTLTFKVIHGVMTVIAVIDVNDPIVADLKGSQRTRRQRAGTRDVAGG